MTPPQRGIVIETPCYSQAKELRCGPRSIHTKTHPISAPSSQRPFMHRVSEKSLGQTWLHELNNVLLYEAGPIGRRTLSQPISDLTLFDNACPIGLVHTHLHCRKSPSNRCRPMEKWSKPSCGWTEAIGSIRGFGTINVPQASGTMPCRQKYNRCVWWQHPAGRQHISCIDGKRKVAFTSRQHAVIDSNISSLRHLTFQRRTLHPSEFRTIDSGTSVTLPRSLRRVIKCDNRLTCSLGRGWWYGCRFLNHFHRICRGGGFLRGRFRCQHHFGRPSSGCTGSSMSRPVPSYPPGGASLTVSWVLFCFNKENTAADCAKKMMQHKIEQTRQMVHFDVLEVVR